MRWDGAKGGLSMGHRRAYVLCIEDALDGSADRRAMLGWCSHCITPHARQLCLRGDVWLRYDRYKVSVQMPLGATRAPLWELLGALM